MESHRAAAQECNQPWTHEKKAGCTDERFLFPAAKTHTTPLVCVLWTVKNDVETIVGLI
jgi:hypothetical protein